MARAYSDGFFSKHHGNPLVAAYQFELSTRHPVFDVCDMYANTDMFNLGKGVYPKDKLPLIPVHPHCLCTYSVLYKSQVDKTKQKDQHHQAISKWIDKLDEKQAVQVMGKAGYMAYNQAKTPDNATKSRGGSNIATRQNKYAYERFIRNYRGLGNPQYRDLALPLREINNREMANGGRKSQFLPLQKEDKEYIINIAKEVGIDPKFIKFRDNARTGYNDELDIIFVSSQVFPSRDNSTLARDRMSVRAVLAHEYYGHRANRNTILKNGDWKDEFRASYSAAINCPNLTDIERTDLVRDALDRAKEAGVSIKLNSKMRAILYGR